MKCGYFSGALRLKNRADSAIGPTYTLRIDMILKNEAPQSRKWISPLLSTVILLAVFITIFTVTTITNVLANTPINLTKNIEQINEGVSEEAIEPSPERRAELERILKFEPWKVDDIDDISGTH